MSMDGQNMTMGGQYRGRFKRRKLIKFSKITVGDHCPLMSPYPYHRVFLGLFSPHKMMDIEG